MLRMLKAIRIILVVLSSGLVLCGCEPKENSDSATVEYFSAKGINEKIASDTRTAVKLMLAEKGPFSKDSQLRYLNLVKLGFVLLHRDEQPPKEFYMTLGRILNVPPIPDLSNSVLLAQKNYYLKWSSHNLAKHLMLLVYERFDDLFKKEEMAHIVRPYTNKTKLKKRLKWIIVRTIKFEKSGVNLYLNSDLNHEAFDVFWSIFNLLEAKKLGFNISNIEKWKYLKYIRNMTDFKAPSWRQLNTFARYVATDGSSIGLFLLAENKSISRKVIDIVLPHCIHITEKDTEFKKALDYHIRNSIFTHYYFTSVVMRDAPEKYNKRWYKGTISLLENEYLSEKEFTDQTLDRMALIMLLKKPVK